MLNAFVLSSALLTLAQTPTPAAAGASPGSVGRAMLHDEPSLARHRVAQLRQHWVQTVRSPSTRKECCVREALPLPIAALRGAPTGCGGGTAGGTHAVLLQVLHGWLIWTRLSHVPQTQ